MANEGTEYEPGKLFVGGLSWETTKENLKQYFLQFGEISDSTIMMDRVTLKPRGFGFVTFTNPDHADAALQHPGPHMIDNKPVDPKKATKSGQSTAEPQHAETMSKPLKVFLGGLPSDATVEDIRAELSKFGPISASADAVEIKMDPNTQRSRGFGFVTFETESAAQAAVKEHFVYLGPKQVEVKKAEDQKAKGGKSYPQGYGASRMYGGGYPNPGGYSQMTPQQQQQQQAGAYGYGSGAAGYPAAYQAQWSDYNYGGGSAGGAGYYPTPQGSNPASSYNGGAYASTGGYNSSRTDSTGAYASAVPQAQGYNYSQSQQPQQALYGYGQQQGYSGRSQEQQGYNNGFPSRQ